MEVDLEKLDLLHRLFMAMGPKIDKQVIKNILSVVTIMVDLDTGEDLKRIIKQL